MKNVTITLDEQLAQWAKVTAARNNKSLSKFIAQLLDTIRSSMGDEQELLNNFKLFSARPISRENERAFKREEMYDRTRIS